MISIVFYSLNYDDALSTLRIIGPASSAGIKIIYGVENGIINIKAVNEGDIVVLQRDICKFHDKFTQILSIARLQQKPIVFDLDDLLFDLPEDHPDRESGYYTDALLPMIQAITKADLVTVATNPLRDYLVPFNSNIKVIPNYLNDALWRFNEINKEQFNDQLITIGYMGGQAHLPDLLMILPALKQIADLYKQKIQFKFWGIKPPEEFFYLLQANWYPPVSFEYKKFIDYFQSETADIVIAPLKENLFNSCKSSIKFLEYSANGFPGVYSNLNPYSEVILNNVDGFLASSPEDWVEMISGLISNHELRFNIVERAQQKIKKNWLLSENYENQIEIYENLIKNHKNNSRTSSHFDIFQLLSTQYFEEKERQNSRIQNLIETNKVHDELMDSLKDQLILNNRIIDDLESQLKTSEQNNQILQIKIDEINVLNNNYENKIEELSDLNDDLTGKVEKNKLTQIDLQNQNKLLKIELLSYLQSKSWTYTRIFRKINRLLRKVNN